MVKYNNKNKMKPHPFPKIMTILIVLVPLMLYMRYTVVDPYMYNQDDASLKLVPTQTQTQKNVNTSPLEPRIKTPEVLSTDRIYTFRTAFVIPEYKLIFFTFPKVACSEWKRMFMRMNDNPKWCIIRGMNAHSPKNNQISLLQDYPTEIATAMMTSPSWTRAAFVREPKERVLSSFLDKSLKEDYFFRKCCERMQDENLKDQCKAGKKDFKSFLYFVSNFPNECSDVHWEGQVDKIDAKWWPFINFIGYQDNLIEDSKRLLKSITSTRDEIPNRSAWDRYGVSGWGKSNEGCENRTHAFLEENSSSHDLGTGKRLMEWYTAETENMVEELWAREWQQSSIQFPELRLHKDG